MTGTKAGIPTVPPANSPATRTAVQTSPEQPAVRIMLLGRFQVLVNEVPVAESRWQRRHARQLVILLALSPQQ